MAVRLGGRDVKAGLSSLRHTGRTPVLQKLGHQTEEAGLRAGWHSASQHHAGDPQAGTGTCHVCYGALLILRCAGGPARGLYQAWSVGSAVSSCTAWTPGGKRGGWALSATRTAVDVYITHLVLVGVTGRLNTELRGRGSHGGGLGPGRFQVCYSTHCVTGILARPRAGL